MKINRLWILFALILTGCLGNEPVRLFTSAPEYILDSTAFKSAVSSQQFAYGFSEMTYLPKRWNYPPSPWLVIPSGIRIPQSNNRKALLFGAILTDLAYLAHYNLLNQGNHLLQYIDSLKIVFPGSRWNTQQMKSLYAHPEKFLMTLHFFQADAELMAYEYENQRLIDYMRIGALIESFYFCSHISTMKTDTLNMIYFLENQKQCLRTYIQYFEEKDTLVAKMLPNFKVIPDLLTLTQTVQVWDSLSQESHLQTFVMEKPVLELQKYIAQLRKEWILFE